MNTSKSLVQARNMPIPDPIDVVLAGHLYSQQLQAELRGALTNSMDTRIPSRPRVGDVQVVAQGWVVPSLSETPGAHRGIQEERRAGHGLPTKNLQQ